MRPGIVGVGPHASPRAVATVMVANEIHAVVVPGHERFVVTDLDVISAALTPDDEAPDWRPGTALPQVPADATLAAAAETMASAEAAHALVTMAGARFPVGMLSSFDVAAVLADRPPRIARLVRPGAAVPARSEGRLGHVTAGDAMHPGVITVPPAASLRELAAVLADRHIHAVVVVGLQQSPEHEEHMVWAFGTDMDVLRAAAAGHLDVMAESVAGAAPLIVDPGDPLDATARALTAHRQRHAIVADELGMPLGVVSTLDVLRVLAIGA
jgi:CBS domain-containing protein